MRTGKPVNFQHNEKPLGIHTNCMFLLFLLPCIAIAQPRFVLESELRTGYTGSNPQPSFTHYTYDTEGNLANRRVFDGVDSLAELMSRIVYSYDSQNRRTEELLLDAGGDTLSIVRYVHGSSGVRSVSVFRRDGTLRYRDSLLYSGGNLVEERRYGATGTMSFYRRYSYTANRLSADTLYEPDGGGFSAIQARLISRNSDVTVSQEAQWRVSGSQWYQISTTEMGWENGNLMMAVKYESDGASKRLIDSLAWNYDSHGNRTREEYYDNERVKNYDIVYTWRDTHTGVLAQSWRNTSAGMSWRNGRLEFGVPVSGSVMILGLDGRRLYERQIQSVKTVSLPEGLASGRYIVSMLGTVNNSFPITINR